MVSALHSGSRGPGSRGLAESLCCVLGQDTLLSQCLSPPRSKWVPGNCQGNLTKCWEVTCDGLTSHPGGVAILLVASIHATETGITSGSNGPLGP